MKRYAVIMSGGAGERFWPLSRIKKPKHLWNIGPGNKCLLQLTLDRTSQIVEPKNILVVTNVEQAGAILQACPCLSKEQVLTEPLARDTFAAVACAAMHISLSEKDEDFTFAVFPSDLLINDVAGFAETILSAFEIAEAGNKLLTVGIKPSFPSTAYGYIQRGKRVEDSLGEHYKAAHFYEKPNLERASMYIDSGDFYWNAGMFVWKYSSIKAASKKYAPKTFKTFEKMRSEISEGKDEQSVLTSYYPELEKISVDFAIMEKADNVWVVPAGFDWDDVGSWSSVKAHYPADQDNNSSNGEFYSRNSSDCLVFDSVGRATALVGVKDLIVVHAGDTTLVCSKNAAQEVKNLVRTLPEKFR